MTDHQDNYWSRKFWPGTKVFFVIVFGPGWRVLCGRVLRPTDRLLNIDQVPRTEPRVLIQQHRGFRYEWPESQVFRTRAAAERAIMVRVMELR